MAVPPSLSDEGYEIQFATNHLGHFLLTKLLLPTLLRSAASPSADVRIVVVTSIGHHWTPTGGIAFEELSTPQANIHTWARYGQSKLANILMARELAWRFPSLTTVVVHPGMAATNLHLSLASTSRTCRWAMQFVACIPGLLKGPEKGACNQLWAAFAPSEDVRSGGYYEPVGRHKRGSAKSCNPELAAQLWKWSEEQVLPWAETIDKR
jgi:NAD(P)-dependent dehydrogenase (short-subunit alcohol dehydrogenase family)